MKKKIWIVMAAVILLSMMSFTVAYAQSDDTVKKGAGMENRIAKLTERVQALEAIKPFVDTVKSNKQKITSLRTDLKAQRKLATAHLKELKQNIETLTDEKLQSMKDIAAQIKTCRDTLKDTNTQMLAERTKLRTARKSKDYEAVKAAYQNIIKIQEQRMAQLNKLIDLNKQLAAI